MKPILSVAEMRRVDAATTANIDRLMDVAGYGVALSAVKLGAGYGKRVQIIAGPGNNGGDGYAAARYLSRRGALVTVQQVGEPPADTPAWRAAEAARNSGVRIVPIGPVEPCDLLIDAFAGTGMRDELPWEVAHWTLVHAPVLAVDIPSGMNGDTGEPNGPVFTASRTATFHAYKTGHFLGAGPDLCGEIDVYDIGLDGGDTDMFLMDRQDVRLPVQMRHAHKWSAGAVATIGGLPGITGAALFAARSVIAAGAGASVLLTTSATAGIYASEAPDIPQMQASESYTWGTSASEVLALLGKFDTLIIGPGLDPVSGDFVEGILDGFDGTVVADAGALNAMPHIGVLASRKAPTVLTPHAGEFSRLTGLAPGIDAARTLAEASQAVVVLKGNPTLVVADEVVFVDTGGPELATIGTGDVLAGMIGAFTAGGVPIADAAASAVYLHGIAGASVALSSTVTPGRLIDAVARVVTEQRAVWLPSL